MTHHTTAAPADPKVAVRTDIRRRRRDHVATLTDRGSEEAALAALLRPLVSRDVVVASYAAIGSEIDPTALHASQVKLAFPRVGRTFLTFHTCDPSALVRGHAGIPEPPVTAPGARPAIILVPLLAATLSGTRLGQGGGYYDRSLAELRADGTILAIGLAWELQIVRMLPSDPWDQQLDWIATPTRLVECASFR